MPEPVTVSIADGMFESVELVPSQAYTRRVPFLFDAPTSIVNSVQWQIDKGQAVAPAGLVGRVRNATILKGGVLLDEQRRVIAESLINIEGEAQFHSEVGEAYADACRDPGNIPMLPDAQGPYVLLKQTWDANYGHWIVESLPRVANVARLHRLERCRFIVTDNASEAMRQVYTDSLGLLGIPPDRIVRLENSSWRAAEVIYASPMTIQPWVKSPEVVRFLNGLRQYRQPDIAGAHRIYVSRNGWGNRRLLNEPEICEVLVARGYKVIQPENYSFTGQIAAFSEAKHIVGTLGAALSNLAFAPDGVKLLALATEFMGDDFFWDLAALKGGSYASIHGRAMEPEKGMYSDFTINLDRFRTIINTFDPP